MVTKQSVGGVQLSVFRLTILEFIRVAWWPRFINVRGPIAPPFRLDRDRCFDRGMGVVAFQCKVLKFESVDGVRAGEDLQFR